MRENKRDFIRLLMLLLLTRAGDALTTYWASPDLQLETNPVVRVFGGGWLSLGLVTTLVTTAILYGAYLYYFSPLPYQQIPARYKTSLLEFTAHAAFGPGARPVHLLYRMPKLGYLARMLGFVGGWGLVLFGLYLIPNNLAVAAEHTWYPYWAALGLDTFVFRTGLLVVIMLGCGYVFLRREYQRAKTEETQLQPVSG